MGVWEDLARCVRNFDNEISDKYGEILIGKDKGHRWVSAIVVATPTRSEPSIAGDIVLENDIRGIFRSAARRD